MADKPISVVLRCILYDSMLVVKESRPDCGLVDNKRRDSGGVPHLVLLIDLALKLATRLK